MALPSPTRKLLQNCRYFMQIGVQSFKTSLFLDKIHPSKAKGSSFEWVKRQINDPYVKKAHEDNFRCRSAYKLIEIDDQYKLLRKGGVVVDCGAAPGSWTQVAVTRVKSSGGNGEVISVDLQTFAPVEGATLFTQSDFTQPETQSKILEKLDGRLVDVVLSDMAPRSSGDKKHDHDVICELCLSVLKFSTQVLKLDGHVVCKLLEGSDRDKMISVMQRMFKTVKIVKPASSRSDSAEIFLLGMHYNLKQKQT